MLKTYEKMLNNLCDDLKKQIPNVSSCHDVIDYTKRLDYVTKITIVAAMLVVLLEAYDNYIKKECTKYS